MTNPIPDLIARLSEAEGLTWGIFNDAMDVLGSKSSQALWFARSEAWTDAVLCLVPEGWSIAMIWEAENSKERPWWGVKLRCDAPYRCLGEMGRPTLALALLIAILKTERSKQESELYTKGWLHDQAEQGKTVMIEDPDNPERSKGAT